MKNLFTFKEFDINESTAAGNRDETYSIPFSYSSNDPKHGYSSKSFVDDLNAIFLEKPELKKEITEFISQNLEISRIDDLASKPFSLISDIIPEIERIIAAGEYEAETMMPGESLLFIRNKKFKDGKGADFYINRKGTKIEVVEEDEAGKETSSIYETTKFPLDRYEFTDSEKEEFYALLKAKGINH